MKWQIDRKLTAKNAKNAENDKINNFLVTFTLFNGIINETA